MLPSPGSVSAPGVVGAVLRRAASGVETLILCDNSRGACSPANARGFYRLLGTGGLQQPALGPKLGVYEVVPGSNALRPYEVTSFLSSATFCAESGQTFFTEGHAVLTLDANNVVRVLAGVRRESGHPEGEASNARFSYPSELAAPDAGTLYVTDSQGLHVLRLDPLPDGSGVVATSVTTLRCHDDDHVGQLSIACTAGCQVVSSATAVYRQWNTDCGLSLESSQWAGEEGLRGTADGCGRDARFSSITAICIDDRGAAVVVDALPDGRTSVRYIDADGDVKTIFNPSVADSGDSQQSTHSCDTSSRAACGSPNYFVDEDQGLNAAFMGGGLRCPLVLADDVLVLCAPLQDTLVFLGVPGLSATHGLRSRVGLAPMHACTTSSNPMAPAGCMGDDECYGACCASAHADVASCCCSNSSWAVDSGIVSMGCSDGNNRCHDSHDASCSPRDGTDVAKTVCGSDEDDACSRVSVAGADERVKRRVLTCPKLDWRVSKIKALKRRRSC